MVEADANRDGTVTAADLSYVQNLYGSFPIPALLDGLITTTNPLGPDNQIGFSGYIFNAETRLYLARYRNYTPKLARWLEHDPIGYADSLNLFGYGTGNPVGVTDPMGLSTTGSYSADMAQDLGDTIRNTCKTQKNWEKYCAAEMEKIKNGETTDPERIRRLIKVCKERANDLSNIVREFFSEVAQGFIDGAKDGAVMAADNLVGIVGMDIDAADKIRDEWGHLASYQAGDWASYIGALVLQVAVEEYLFGGICFILRRACFVEDTQIAMADGTTKPIQDIETGDLVLSFDDETGEQTVGEVTATFASNSPRLVTLSYQTSFLNAADSEFNASTPDSESLIGTPEHPFWCVSEDRWIQMGALQNGDRLLLADGSEAMVIGLEIETTAPGSSGFNVYNFEVGKWNNYHVSELANSEDKAFVLVHNAGEPCGLVSRTVYIAFKNGKLEYVGRTINFVRRAAEHRRVPRKIKAFATDLTLSQMRALEQALIDSRGLKNLTNAINGIAQRKLDKYSDELIQYFNNLRTS